jgi:hypothetical protein
MVEVFDFVDQALELMKQSVKDVQEKARIIRKVIKILGKPWESGELMHGDTYGLGPKTFKSRVDRVRVMYCVNGNGQPELREITRRSEVYGHGFVGCRRKKR